MSATPNFSFYVLAQRVHCKVSRWTKWTACSVTCGRGIQLRGRAILKQPMNDGLPCPTLTESKSCFIRNCSSKLLMNWQFPSAFTILSFKSKMIMIILPVSALCYVHLICWCRCGTVFVQETSRLQLHHSCSTFGLLCPNGFYWRRMNYSRVADDIFGHNKNSTVALLTTYSNKKAGAFAALGLLTDISEAQNDIFLKFS